jgi:hypothetical protein
MWFDPRDLEAQEMKCPATLATSATFDAGIDDCPPATSATSATFEPLDEKESQESQESQTPHIAIGCRHCRHIRRPGLSDGHCGGRDDLPPAYGEHHPLRRLPDDMGATCEQFEEWT